MFLSGLFFGISNFKNLGLSPTVKERNRVSFLGDNIFSNIHMKDRVLINKEIDNIDITQVPVWDSETLLLASFQTDSLSAGNIVDLSSPITGWGVSRREIGTNVIKNLADLDVEVTEYTDYTAQGNKKYQYLVFPKTQDGIGITLETDEINTNFYGWYLIDEDTSNVYLFDLNLSSDEIKNTTDYTEYESYTKYNAYSFGQRDYISGKITCIAGSINQDGKLVQPAEYLDDLRSFINNKKDKLLKNRKGDIWRVITPSGMNLKYMDNVGEQVVTISFDFIEVGVV